MPQVVLDSNNMEAVLADARGEVQETTKPKGNGEDKTGAHEGQSAADDDSSVSRETKQADKTTEIVDPDDVEGEDGLTPREKRELSAKMQKAVGKRHRQMKEAEEFAAAQYSERKLAEERAAQLQAQIDALKAKDSPQEEKAPEKPNRQNFGTDAEYVEALTDWKVEQKLQEQAAKQAKEAQERAAAQIEATAKERIANALKLVPDFQEVTEAADVEVPPVIAGYMQKSEMFAELGYYLAKNPEIMVSLGKLPPDEQLVKIGKIEGMLKPFSETTGKPNGATPSTEATKASETTGMPQSKARNSAPVIKPLSTTGAAVDKEAADMNIRETIADWQKRKGANLGIRKRH